MMTYRLACAGGYWSLDKRSTDLTTMEAEWEKWGNEMASLVPRLVHDADVRSLGTRLRALAPQLHERLHHEPSLAQGGFGTTIHGDFKTANIFFRAQPLQKLPLAHASVVGAEAKGAGEAGRPCGRIAAPLHASSTEGFPSVGSQSFCNGAAAAGERLLHPKEASAEQAGVAAVAVAVCDFQWVGGGVCLQDVMYLLWTSVQPAVVLQQEASLVSAYLSALREAVQLQGCAANAVPCNSAAFHLYEVLSGLSLLPCASGHLAGCPFAPLAWVASFSLRLPMHVPWRRQSMHRHPGSHGRGMGALDSEPLAHVCRLHSWIMCASSLAACGEDALLPRLLPKRMTSTKACTSGTSGCTRPWSAKPHPWLHSTAALDSSPCNSKSTRSPEDCLYPWQLARDSNAATGAARTADL
jgi:hypothetical protein